MDYYKDLVETLVKMSEITRPKVDPKDDKYTKWQKRIQDGICDLLDDAAAALDDLIKKVEEHEQKQERKVLQTTE